MADYLVLHQQVMFWCWALGVDVALVVVRQFKTFRFYMDVHGAIMFLLCALSLWVEILVLKSKWKFTKRVPEITYAHLMIGISFSFVLMFQILLGVNTNLFIHSTNFSLTDFKQI